jgi:hypothetical protein
MSCVLGLSAGPTLLFKVAHESEHGLAVQGLDQDLGLRTTGTHVITYHLTNNDSESHRLIGFDGG